MSETVSKIDLNSLTIDELDLLEKRLREVRAGKKQQDALTEELPQFIRAVATSVEAARRENSNLPAGGKKRDIDIAVGSKAYFKAATVLAREDYEKAIRVLEEKLKVTIRVYQGITKSSCMGETDYNPDARAKIYLYPEDAGGDNIAARVEGLVRDVLAEQAG